MSKEWDSSDSSKSDVNPAMDKPLCALALAAPLSIQYTDMSDRPAVVLSATSTIQERGRHHRRRRRLRRRASRRHQERQDADNEMRWREQDVGGSGYRKDGRWTLKQILDTLQNVWQTPPSSRQQQKTTYSDEESQSRFSSNGMCDRFRKISCVSTSEVSSPILLRRRLSAPETIMRKYVLAQRRIETQGSNDLSGMNHINALQQRTSTGASAITSVVSSNPNLTRRRHDTMRKSTLIRRLWGNQPLLGGAYAEWQYSCGKVGASSTHSLGSVQSSPEHGRLSNSRRSLPDEFYTSPKHITSSRRLSPNRQVNRTYTTGPVNSTHRKMSLYNINYDNANGTATTTMSYTTPVSNSSFTSNSDSNRSTRSNIDTSTKTDSIRNSTNNSTTMINYSEKSASTYTNSNYTTTSNHDHSNLDLQISNDIKNESSTQTMDSTNLNVISNIQLSDDTINLIYNQVMHDVNNITTPASNDRQRMVDVTSANTNTKLYTVQQTPSFYLNQVATSSTAIKQFTDYSRIVKYMISNVEAGSSYKPAEVPQLIVPRYSALPRSSSMEVNTSSADSTDHEDTISLVDSLEEHISPRSDRKEIAPKLTPPLPDNSGYVANEAIALMKPMSFYVPIASAEENEEYKTMADHFPSRLREKISKRQKKREEKRQLNRIKEFSPRSGSNYISASDKGNDVQYFINSASFNDLACGGDYKFNKSKKKSKALLPIIEPIGKVRAANGSNERIQPIEEKLLSTRKQYPKLESSHMKCKESPWLARNRSKEKNSYVQSKFNSTDNLMHRQGRLDGNCNSKRIEIMEIMEFVEPERNQGKRSKIPILVQQQQKLPKLPHVHTDKPIYLDFEQVEIMDPKLDQLIANILIDTLHNPHFQSNVKINQENILKKMGNINEKRPMDEPQSKYINKYAQKFEAIPEERSFPIAPEETSVGIKYSNNNMMLDSSDELQTSRVLINNNVDSKESSYQGKAAIADNVTSLPKGWITFYTLRKSQSPDSASDEGDQTMDIRNEQASSSQHTIRAEENIKCCSEKSTSTMTYTNKEQQQFVAKEDTNAKLKNSTDRHGNEIDQRWSLTLSGSSSCGQLPPELEMRLKFPRFSQTGSEESTVQEPSICTSRRTQTSRSHIDFDNRLPDIMHKSSLYRNEESNMRQSMDVLTKGLPTNPRPTKTSTRRYCLTHNIDAQFGQRAVCNHNSIRSNRQQFLLGDGNVRYTSDNRDFTEILRRFPELMKITGNNIISERKSRISLDQDYDYHQNTFRNIQP